MNDAHIYVLGELEEPDGYVKVGLHYGKAMKSGRAGLSTGNWRTLVVLHHHPLPAETARWTEYLIHRHLHRWHIRGEWFDLRPLLAQIGDWATLLDRAAMQGIPGGTRFTLGTPEHSLDRVRMLRWQPPKELIAECSCGSSVHAIGTTLPGIVRRFRDEHAEPPPRSLVDLELRRFVDEVNADLAGSFTPNGVRRWWARPRGQLNGRTPADVIRPPFDANHPDAQVVRQLAAGLHGAGGFT
jgi:hypothetical protein